MVQVSHWLQVNELPTAISRHANIIAIRFLINIQPSLIINVSWFGFFDRFSGAFKASPAYVLKITQTPPPCHKYFIYFGMATLACSKLPPLRTPTT